MRGQSRQHVGQTLRNPGGPEDGYTLTEMLVVIAIIGLIAAILTPGLMNQLGRARVKAAQLQLETTATSVEMFRTDVGRYPTQQEGLTALLAEPSGAAGWTGPYLRDAKALKDPWGTPIDYLPSADGQDFHVRSLGANRALGGSGTGRDLQVPEAP